MWRTKFSPSSTPSARRQASGSLRRALDFYRALHRFQRAAEFREKSVADRFDFDAVQARKNFPQQATMFFQQFEREFVIALGQCAVANHVGEHDGSQPALFVIRHP